MKPFLVILLSEAGTGGPGGPLAPSILCRSFNPIWTGEGRLSPPITTGTPNVFHLPASLLLFLTTWPRTIWIKLKKKTKTKTTTARKLLTLGIKNQKLPFRTSLLKIFKIVSYEINLASQCSHSEVIFLSKFWSEKG